ncbi:MAG: phage integrase N-terminal SAM-like domain-containing protein [Candidatus Peribacteria bacterium]|nr:MAG: phage integrase N-terminal SAM-like domain-containing protein [Candidatus Peribacteria bacterium]
MQNTQEYLHGLKKELQYRNYSFQTIKAYTGCIQYFLNTLKKDPTTVSRDEIIDFLLHLQHQKKAPKTINIYKEAIKFFYHEVLKTKQELDIRFSREAKKLPVVLSREEIHTLLSNIKNTKHRLMIALSYGA